VLDAAVAMVVRVRDLGGEAADHAQDRADNQPRKPLQTEQKQLKLTDARCCCYVAQHVAHNLHLADIELEDGMLEKAIEVCWEDKAKL
jgi:hypothetical protein